METLTYTITDPFGVTASTTFTVTMATPPTFVSGDASTFTIGSSGTFGFAAEGFPAPTFSLTGTLPDGVVFDEASGTLSGTPAAGTQGSFTFTITASNGIGDPASQSFTLTINRPPVTRDDTLGAVQDTPVQVSAAKLLANDRDPDDDPLALTAVSPASAQGGSVALDSGVITYTPPVGVSGADTFTYTADDGRGGTTTATVHVTISPAPPTIGQSSIEILPEGVRVRFHGIPGRSYRIQFSDDLSSWQDVPGDPVTAAPNGIYEYLDPTDPVPAMRFYRGVSNP